MLWTYKQQQIFWPTWTENWLGTFPTLPILVLLFTMSIVKNQNCLNLKSRWPDGIGYAKNERYKDLSLMSLEEWSSNSNIWANFKPPVLQHAFRPAPTVIFLATSTTWFLATSVMFGYLYPWRHATCTTWCFSVFKYDVFLPVWCLINCVMSAHLYDVCLTVWRLSTCTMFLSTSMSLQHVHAYDNVRVHFHVHVHVHVVSRTLLLWCF
jgi:hypothetical protein